MALWARKKSGDTWSPYGHEAARRRLLAERRLWLIVGAIAVALLYALFLQLTLETVEDPGSSTAEVERQEQEPFTVTVRPGGQPAFVDPQIEAPDGIQAPGLTPQEESKTMQLVRSVLSLLAPLAVALWLLSRVGTSARGKLAELNMGVYKGAMPYEMHTARAFDRVFTYREVDGHVFGKTREDFLWGTYLGSPPLSVRRLLGEEGPEPAQITELKHGGARRVVVKTQAERKPGWGERAGLFFLDLEERLRATRDRRVRAARLARRNRLAASARPRVSSRRSGF